MTFCCRGGRVRRISSITSHDARDGVTTEDRDDPERIGSSHNDLDRFPGGPLFLGCKLRRLVERLSIGISLDSCASCDMTSGVELVWPARKTVAPTDIRERSDGYLVV